MPAWAPPTSPWGYTAYGHRCGALYDGSPSTPTLLSKEGGADAGESCRTHRPGSEGVPRPLGGASYCDVAQVSQHRLSQT
jgi:hypothetical protein